jgi:hypothetical protein
MKSVTFYPFSMGAGKPFIVPAEGDYFRVQSSLGSISVTIEGAGTLPALQSGQGIKNTPFNRLILRDTSGAANSGVILVASEEFIDNRTYGVNDLSAGSLATLRQPLASTGFYSSVAAIAANTAEQIFSPAANVNGAILLSASFSDSENAGFAASFVAKASAPANIADGEVIDSTSITVVAAVAGAFMRLPKEQFISAGKGLYFISNSALTANQYMNRSARFRLL